MSVSTSSGYKETILAASNIDPSQISVADIYSNPINAVFVHYQTTYVAGEDKQFASISVKNKIKENKIYEGHDEGVTAVCFTDDLLISASRDGKIKIWDDYRERCKWTIAGHQKSINALVRISRRKFATGSNDNIVKIWKFVHYSGRRHQPTCDDTLEGHTDTIYSLVKLSDHFLASGSGDTTIRIWNRKAIFIKCEHVLEEHSAVVSVLLCLNNGYLASGSGDKTIKIWDYKSGKCLETLTGHQGGVTALEQVLSGELISGSSDGTLRIWNTENKSCLLVSAWHPSGVSAISLLPNGKLLTGSNSGQLKLWNFEASRCVSTKMIKDSRGIGELIKLSNQTIAFSTNSDKIHVWDREIDKITHTFEGHDKSTISLLEINHGLLVSYAPDKKIFVWDLDNPVDKICLQGHHDTINCVIQLKNGHLASCSSDGKIKIWDYQESTCVKTLSDDDKKVYSILCLDQNRLISSAGYLKIWDIKEGVVLKQLGDYLYKPQWMVMLDYGNIIRWTERYIELIDPVKQKRLKHEKNRLFSENCFTPPLLMFKDRDFVKYTEYAELKMYSGNDWNLKGVFKQPKGFFGIRRMYELNEKIFAIVNPQSILSLWNCHSMQCFAIFSNDSGNINGASQLDDGNLLCWSSDGTITTWNFNKPLFSLTSNDTSEVKTELEILPLDVISTEKVQVLSDPSTSSSHSTSTSESSSFNHQSLTPLEVLTPSIPQEKDNKDMMELVLKRLTLIEQKMEQLSIENRQLREKIKMIESNTAAPNSESRKKQLQRTQKADRKVPLNLQNTLNP